MCHYILLWYLQISALVPCWLQVPSVNQTCPFLSRLGQCFSHSSLVGTTIRYLPIMHLRITRSFIILNLLSILSAFTQIRLCLIFRFFRFVVGWQYAAISAADSIADPRASPAFLLGVVLITPVIIIHATLCRRSSSDLAKAMSILFPNATATYMWS